MITAVESNSFQVNFAEIANATFYTVRVFFNSMLINEINSTSTNVVIDRVNPIENEYRVEVAYNTPAPSDFSASVTTSKYPYIQHIPDTESMKIRV